MGQHVILLYFDPSSMKRKTPLSARSAIPPIRLVYTLVVESDPSSTNGHLPVVGVKFVLNIRFNEE